MKVMPELQRLALHIAAASIVLLAMAAISPARLLDFDRFLPFAITALISGALISEVTPILRRISKATGCLTNALVTMLTSAGVLWLLGTVLPGMRITTAGVVIGAALMMLAAGVLFTLFDETPHADGDPRG